jgi:hypothetical protein
MGAEFTTSEKKTLMASLTTIAGALQRQEALLSELSLWTRLGATEQAKAFFERILDTDTKKWVYEALDGEATQTMIQDKTSVNQASVSIWGREWQALGIVAEVRGGKRRKIIPLCALGIEVPPLPKKEA